jgi:hypothetical protein
MNKEFIPYQEALELKQLGFDEPCNTCYDKLKMVVSYGASVFDYKNYNTSGYMVSRPTYSQSFRWFREKHDIDIYIDIRFLKHDDGISLKKYKVLIPFPNELFIDVGLFTTHEEAELECLKKLIELVKTHEGGNK